MGVKEIGTEWRITGNVDGGVIVKIIAYGLKSWSKDLKWTKSKRAKSLGRWAKVHRGQGKREAEVSLKERIKLRTNGLISTVIMSVYIDYVQLADLWEQTCNCILNKKIDEMNDSR